MNVTHLWINECVDSQCCLSVSTALNTLQWKYNNSPRETMTIHDTKQRNCFAEIYATNVQSRTERHALMIVTFLELERSIRNYCRDPRACSMGQTEYFSHLTRLMPKPSRHYHFCHVITMRPHRENQKSLLKFTIAILFSLFPPDFGQMCAQRSHVAPKIHVDHFSIEFSRVDSHVKYGDGADWSCKWNEQNRFSRTKQKRSANEIQFQEKGKRVVHHRFTMRNKSAPVWKSNFVRLFSSMLVLLFAGTLFAFRIGAMCGAWFTIFSIHFTRN